MGRIDLYIGLGLMAVAATFFALTFQFPKQTLAMPPTLFPRIISTGLFILAGLLVFQSWKKKGITAKTQEKVSLPWARFIFMILLAFLYTRLLEAASYILATPFLIAGLMIIFYEKRWSWIISVSMAVTFILYILFRIIFKVPLPRFEFF